MSWDIFVQDLPGNALSVTDIPGGFKPQAFLARSGIVEVFRELAPFTDFSDPTWRADCPQFSIEVCISTEDPSRGFALHVRGGDEAVGLIHEILQRLGVRALDPSSDSGFFDLEASKESFRKWRAYRDSVAR